MIHPKIGGRNLEKFATDYMEKDEEEKEIEILTSPPPVFMTLKKKRVVKIKERLDDSFLRRSRRVA